MEKSGIKYENIENMLIFILLIYVFWYIINSYFIFSDKTLAVLSTFFAVCVFLLIKYRQSAGHYLLTFILFWYITLSIPELNSFFTAITAIFIVYIWTEIINPGEQVKETSMCLVWAIIMAKIVLFVLNTTFSTDTPIVAVISNSMRHDATNEEYSRYIKEKGWPFENGFQGGDVLIIFGANKKYRVGDVVVYRRVTVPMPIVHRIIGIVCKSGRQVERSEECQEVDFYITRGDHNPAPDKWRVSPDVIEGKAVLRLPRLGLIKAAPVCAFKGGCSVISCLIEGNCR